MTRKPYARLTPELSAQVVADRKRGMTYPALSAKYGIASSSVWNALHKDGTTKMQTVLPMAARARLWKSIAKDYVNKVPAAEIMDVYHVCKQDIYRALEYCEDVGGMTIPRRGRV